MKDDKKLQAEVISEIQQEPGARAERIGVHVDDGVVHVTGEVDSYPEKLAVERAVKRVPGVEAIAEDIRVNLPDEFERNDQELARLAASALEWNVAVPHDGLKVTVQDGWVSLDGEVDHWYQHNAAEEAVRNLIGVKGITNRISIKPSPTPADLKDRIEKTIVRAARLEAEQINVEVRDSKAILKGNVRTWAEREDAERAACNTPGICEVDNQITVAL